MAEDCGISRTTKTLKEAKRVLGNHGLTINKRDDTFRVNFRHGLEATAYYTESMEDAIATGLDMAGRRGMPANELCIVLCDKAENAVKRAEEAEGLTLPDSPADRACLTAYALTQAVRRVLPRGDQGPGPGADHPGAGRGSRASNRSLGMEALTTGDRDEEAATKRDTTPRCPRH